MRPMSSRARMTHCEMSDDDLETPSEGEHETAEQKEARLEAVLRKYRATLRNEAETEAGGFSADYYRSQKPPHW